jgi:hypothetical protein
MAKLTAGRFLLATRGASLFLQSNEHDNTHQLSVLEPMGTGFPGTLAVFELPIEVRDNDALLDVIRTRAQERIPTSSKRSWLAFAPPPAGVHVFTVRDAGDGTDAAQQLSERIRAAIASSNPVAVDFQGIHVATQSFLHALLFHPVRVAWALGIPIYVFNDEPAVRGGLEYLESYAL